MMNNTTTVQLVSRTDHDEVSVITLADTRGRRWTFVATPDPADEVVIDPDGRHFGYDGSTSTDDRIDPAHRGGWEEVIDWLSSNV